MDIGMTCGSSANVDLANRMSSRGTMATARHGIGPVSPWKNGRGIRPRQQLIGSGLNMSISERAIGSIVGSYRSRALKNDLATLRLQSSVTCPVKIPRMNSHGMESTPLMYPRQGSPLRVVLASRI